MARNSSLRFDAATPATTTSCFSPSTVLTSRISGSKWRERTCSLFCIFAVHSFTLIVVFTTLPFVFILLSVLTRRITDLFVRPVWWRRTQGGKVHQRLRASCCPTSDTGHDNKAFSFPETKNGLVFLCRCPASGANFGWQRPSQGGLQWCWRVGAVSNFPQIHLDTTHARPNGVMLVLPRKMEFWSSQIWEERIIVGMLCWIQELSVHTHDAVCESLWATSQSARDVVHYETVGNLLWQVQCIWWKVLSQKLDNIQESLVTLSSFPANYQLPSLKRWCLLECIHCRRERMIRLCDHYWWHRCENTFGNVPRNLKTVCF